MSNFVSTNRERLKSRHYIRLATANTFWFDFTKGRMDFYIHKYQDNFCLVISGSKQIDDAFVIPYKNAKSVFTNEGLDHRNRWSGYILNETFRIPKSNKSLSVRQYHNAFKLLNE